MKQAMAENEIEGHRQRKLGPQPTKWVASEETLALSPKLDGLVETAVPKVVVTLGKLPPRDVHQQEAPTDVTLPNPKRRKTIFLDKLPPADVPLLEQSTTRKAAVFHKLLSKNGASMEEPFAVCRTREEESTPSKAAVFNRVMSRRAATSDDPAPKSDAKLGTSAESSKSDDDMEVEGGVVVEPAVPEVTLEISANHVKVKATDRQTEGGEMDVEEEASDPTISTGEVQSEPVAETDVHSPSAASRGCSTPDRLVIVEDPEMSQNVEGIQTPRRDSLPPSEISSVMATPDCRRMASASETLNQNVGGAEVKKGDSDLPKVRSSGCSTDDLVCAISEEEKEEEGDEDDEEDGSSISLEDGEIRDYSSTEPSDHESSYLWPEIYVYPSTSRCRGYLVNPFLNYRTGALQSTSSSSRNTCDAASSSSSGTSTNLPAGALSSSGLVLPFKQFYAELVDRLKNLQLSGFARPDLPPHSPPSAGNCHTDHSRRYEHTNCVERKVPKRKSSKPSDIYFRRASSNKDSNHSD